MSINPRICEYFVITGLSKSRKPYDLTQICSNTEEIFKTNVEIEKDFFKFKEPLVDIQLICQKEQLPPDFTLLDRSHSRQFKADLYGKSSVDELMICYKLGRDKPPIIELGVFNPKLQKSAATSTTDFSSTGGERGGGGWMYLDRTITNQHSANLNSNANPLCLAYKRAAPDVPVDCRAVTDVCVILANKGEHCPPAYDRVATPIKRTALSHTINICYKRSIVKQRTLTYQPETLYCLPCTSTEPLVDVCNADPSRVKPTSNGLPPEINDVANFCMPWGATLEAWSASRLMPKPSFLSFVLTDEKYNRMYGAAMLFYDEISRSELTEAELDSLQLGPEDHDNSEYRVFASKSMCLVSCCPLLDTFFRVLQFLLTLDRRQRSLNSQGAPSVPPERFLSQLLHVVPLPSDVVPNLRLEWDLDRPIVIHLPQSAHNLYHLLRLLNVDQCIQLFLYVLTEQKILLTSTNNADLVGMAEALISTIYPFRWSVTYIPFLYLSCIHIIQSPSPYLIGVDSRFFDYFLLPEGVSCVDLVTSTIKPPQAATHQQQQTDYRHLDYNKVLPKTVLKTLSAGLASWKHKVQTFEKELDLRQATGRQTDDLSILKKREAIGNSIRDCFLHALILLFKNYKAYLLPLESRTNLDDMFLVDNFLKSVDKNSRPLYLAIFDTQLWNNFILSRSQSSTPDDSLVFFDRCIKTVSDMKDETSNTTPFFQVDSVSTSEHTKVVEPPEPVEGWEPDSTRLGFPNSLESRFMYTSTHKSQAEVDAANLTAATMDTGSSQYLNGSADPLIAGLDSSRGSNASFTVQESAIPVLLIRPPEEPAARSSRRHNINSILRRPVEEQKQARQAAREAKGLSESGRRPAAWSAHLLSASYSLWYMCLPGLVGHVLDTPGLAETQLAERILQLAMETVGGLVQIVNLNLAGINTAGNQLLPDEVCCRVVMLLVHQLRPCSLMRPSDVSVHAPLNAFSYGLCNQIMLEEKQEMVLRQNASAAALEDASQKDDLNVEMARVEIPMREESPAESLEEKEVRLSVRVTIMENDEKETDSGRETAASGNLVSEEESRLPQKSAVRLLQKRNVPAMSSDGCSIEIGGRRVLLRGKQQTVSRGGGGGGAGQTTDKVHNRRSQLMFQPTTAGDQAAVAGNHGFMCHDHRVVQYFNNSAGIIMSSTRAPSSHDKATPAATCTVPTEAAAIPTAAAAGPSANPTSTSVMGQSSQDTNPMTNAIIRHRSPFSEERSEIHHSFLRGRAPIHEEEPSSLATVTPSDTVSEVIGGRHDPQQPPQSDSTQDRMSASQTDYGSGGSDAVAAANLANKTRVSFRQVKSAANKSLRSMKSIMSSMGTGSWLSPVNQAPNSGGGSSSVDGSGPGVGGLPATFRPWSQTNNSGNRQQKQQQQQNKMGGRFTASVDLLDTIGDRREVVTNSPAAMGMASVQQVRRGQSQLTANYHHFPGSSNSCESIHSDRSVSTASLESDQQSVSPLNLNRIWEQVTASLAAIKLPTGKYWPPAQMEDQTDGPRNDSAAPVTVECRSCLRVNMTSCTECPGCQQPLYDDCIMDAWSADDSDHLALCPCCRTATTPKLSFQVYIVVSEPGQNDTTASREVLAYRGSTHYLSPFVVRKELESVVQHEGEASLLRPDFPYRHDVLYWNLIWFFTRLQMPTHLLSFLTLWLRSRGLALKAAQANQADMARYQILLDLTGYEEVYIYTFWEFSQLSTKFGAPLYRDFAYFYQTQHKGVLMNNRIQNSMIIVDQVVECIINNDLSNAIHVLINFRKQRLIEMRRAVAQQQQPQQTLSPTKQEIMTQVATDRSIYRELFFLILVHPQLQAINFDIFHSLFHECWANILRSSSQLLVGPQDTPISNQTLCCRKVFRYLQL